MKLSKRLQQIDQMITTKYDHIWDCCCDHGFLGIRLLDRNAASTIHFVDVVAPLIADLESSLLQHHPKQSKPPTLNNRWQVHCLSAEKIPIQSEGSNLVIIAGVGGELLIDLVEAILTTHPNQTIDFLLCPVHHNYKVRQSLIQLGLGLVDERLVNENKRFYEIIYTSTDSKLPISPVGSVMWNFTRQDDVEYLSQTLAHYQRIQKTEDTILLKYTQKVISAYRSLNTLVE
mgnify:FL=1